MCYKNFKNLRCKNDQKLYKLSIRNTHPTKICRKSVFIYKKKTLQWISSNKILNQRDNIKNTVKKSHFKIRILTKSLILNGHKAANTPASYRDICRLTFYRTTGESGTFSEQYIWYLPWFVGIESNLP